MMKYNGEVNYISSGSKAKTVEELIKVLQNIPDKNATVSILDDNLNVKPVTDIAVLDDGSIAICDF